MDTRKVPPEGAVKTETRRQKRRTSQHRKRRNRGDEDATAWSSKNVNSRVIAFRLHAQMNYNSNDRGLGRFTWKVCSKYRKSLLCMLQNCCFSTLTTERARRCCLLFLLPAIGVDSSRARDSILLSLLVVLGQVLLSAIFSSVFFSLSAISPYVFFSWR